MWVSIVPTHVLQLFTLHVYVDLSSFPVAYGITNRKTKTFYRLVQTLSWHLSSFSFRHFFRTIDAQLKKKPSSCVSDFATAAIKVVEEVWREIDVGLCHVKMTQSVFRRVKKDS
ncbi:hypothetical protein L596_023243 [Steinernema carpocapsae]|uniref:MULE transposase domain-containing protein n=1 Tax=Steinernema carpocapsae TaxID=34508 RepID=A0A4U5MD26_STECR|nr:hypothetical protein L596_023243 [Steinernema carpocapsae]